MSNEQVDYIEAMGSAEGRRSLLIFRLNTATFGSADEQAVRELLEEVDALKEWEETAKQLDKAKLPCGHNSRYGYTEDGGKHGICTLCEIARRDAPVSDEDVSRAERVFDNSTTEDQKVWWRDVLEDFHAARATPPHGGKQ